jgi:hypothetical protein
MEPPSPIPPASNSHVLVAVFRRQGDGAASGGGDNEWYSYAPDLSPLDHNYGDVFLE